MFCTVSAVSFVSRWNVAWLPLELCDALDESCEARSSWHLCAPRRFSSGKRPHARNDRPRSPSRPRPSPVSIGRSCLHARNINLVIVREKGHRRASTTHATPLRASDTILCASISADSSFWIPSAPAPTCILCFVDRLMISTTSFRACIRGFEAGKGSLAMRSFPHIETPIFTSRLLA